MDAIRRELNKMPIDDTVVIGKGERDKAPMLFIGERVGNNNGPKVDIAVDPLWHDTLRQGHAGSNRDNGDGRRQYVAERPRCLHAEDRNRSG